MIYIFAFIIYHLLSNYFILDHEAFLNIRIAYHTHSNCVELKHQGRSNGPMGLTGCGLRWLALAVFMDTPGAYRLFLIKDIKQGEQPGPQSTCFLHFHYTCLLLCSKTLHRTKTQAGLPLQLLYISQF